VHRKDRPASGIVIVPYNKIELKILDSLLILHKKNKKIYFLEKRNKIKLENNPNKQHKNNDYSI